jgi:hypothetical protein
MSAPTQTPAEWISKEEAAQMLGVSTRQIERLAARGLIKRRYTKPGKGNRYGKVEVEGGTVLEMTHERRAALRAPSDASTDVAVVPVARSQSRQIAPQTDFFANLAVKLAGLSELALKYGPPQTKPWLTFEEAVEYSGLTPTMLETAIRDAEVTALGRGRGTWRISRRTLDEHGKAGA